MRTDLRQGDVRHGQVQVRDPRDDDQGDENEPGALGSGRRVVGGALRPHRGAAAADDSLTL